MSVDRVISGGRVVTADGIRPADVLVTDGKITGLVAPGTAPSDAGEVVDATGRFVLPGSIDVHVHLRGIARQNRSTEMPYLRTRQSSCRTVIPRKRAALAFTKPARASQRCNTGKSRKVG